MPIVRITALAGSTGRGLKEKSGKSSCEFVKAVIAFPDGASYPSRGTRRITWSRIIWPWGLPDVSCPRGTGLVFAAQRIPARHAGHSVLRCLCQEDQDGTDDDSIYIGYNFHWEKQLCGTSRICRDTRLLDKRCLIPGI